jgi:hypothetical protein
MTMGPLRILAGAAIAALVVGTFSTLPATATSAPPAKPTPRANFAVPKVGECHLLTIKQAFGSSDARTPVPCTSKHTTMTIGVKRLTGSVNWNDKSALYSKLRSKCWNALERVLGSSDVVRAQTAYSWVWFRPTKEQIRRGAKWLRCDLVLSGATKLMPIKADVTVSSRTITDRIRNCVTSRGALTVCSRPHAYRSVGAFRISGGYPSKERARALAFANCGRFVTSRRFIWLTPSREQWNTGTRAMICFNVTPR